MPALTDTNIRIQSIADFNGDGDSDILWFNSKTGFTALWKMSGGYLGNSVVLPTQQDTSSQIHSVIDFNNDGNLDMLWYSSTTNTIKIWLTDGTNRFGDEIILPNA